MYTVVFSASIEKKRKKLRQRNPVLLEAIKRKTLEIAQNPEHYKPLRGELAGLRRVHFGSYVLVYRIEQYTVYFIDLDHHDTIYTRE